MAETDQGLEPLSPFTSAEALERADAIEVSSLGCRLAHNRPVRRRG